MLVKPRFFSVVLNKIVLSQSVSCNMIWPPFLSIIVVDILKTTMVDKIPSDLEVMEASMQQLLALNDNVFRYVDDVVW